jgi:hypothetical protein
VKRHQKHQQSPVLPGFVVSGPVAQAPFPMTLKSFIACGLLVASGPLLAQAIPASTTFGDPGCSEWFVQPNAPKKLWLMGFLSGLNVAADRAGTPTKDLLGTLTSASQAFLSVDNFCRANPKSTVEAAGLALMDELRKKRR